MLKIMLIRHFATPGNEKDSISEVRMKCCRKRPLFKAELSHTGIYYRKPHETLCTNGKADLGYGFIRVSYRFGTFDERV